MEVILVYVPDMWIFTEGDTFADSIEVARDWFILNCPPKVINKSA